MVLVVFPYLLKRGLELMIISTSVTAVNSSVVPCQLSSSSVVSLIVPFFQISLPTMVPFRCPLYSDSRQMLLHLLVLHCFLQGLCCSLECLEIIFRGSPRLAENLLKLIMMDEVDKSGTMSRCTARTMQQVYRQSQTFPPTVVSVPLM